MWDKESWKGLAATLFVCGVVAFIFVMFFRGVAETAKDFIK